MIAKEKSDELKRKQEQYSKESAENEKLRDKNKELERDRNMLKMQNREQRELLKMYRK
jgi:cell division protein FtsB